MSELTHIKLPEPRRSWLIHCNDAEGDLGVCAVTVERGAIAIYAPQDSGSFELERGNIAEFRAAIDAAIDVAEADLVARAATTRPSSS